MDSATKINTLKQGLRIKYATDVPGLRTLWGTVFAGSTEFVEITGSAYEGGSDTGVPILERLEYLKAVQDVLAELDPDNIPTPPADGAFADFRYGYLQT